MVDLALQNNLSLEVARANLAKAQEGLNAARGARSIQVDAAAGVERRKYGAYFLGPEAETFPTFSAYTVGPDGFVRPGSLRSDTSSDRGGGGFRGL